jgi:hypothetical protein
MTSVVNLSPSLQYLVDSRLDSIERALFGTDITRAERREIVQSVEDQILELLSRRSEVEPTRDSVLTVLAEIDPPEAYVPADCAPHYGVQTPRSSRPALTSSTERSPQVAPLAIISFALGLIMCLCCWLVTVDENALVIFLLFAAGLAAPITGSVGLALTHYGGGSLKRMWPAAVGVSLPSLAFTALLILTF